VLVAWLLVRGRFPGRTLLDALVHLPLVVPPVVVGWALLMLFGVRGPVGAPLHEWFGIRLVFTSDAVVLATAGDGLPADRARGAAGGSKAWTRGWRRRRAPSAPGASTPS
jgi:ABC-type molybdate transport system permease subunit